MANDAQMNSQNDTATPSAGRQDDLQELRRSIEKLEAELLSARQTIVSLTKPPPAPADEQPRAVDSAMPLEFPELDTYVPGPGLDTELFRAFARAMLSRTDDDLISKRPMDEQLKQLESQLRFLHHRNTQDILVRAFVPTVETHGYTLPYTVVETCMTDQRFILDTLELLFEGQELKVRSILHPILEVTRHEGLLAMVGPASSTEGSLKESIMHWELEPALTPAQLESLAAAARSRLLKAQTVVRDFRRIVRRVGTLANDLSFQAEEQPQRGNELEEIASLLHWLRQEKFVFMSYERFDLVPGANGSLHPVSDPKSRLGLRSIEDTRGLPETALEWLQDDSLLFVGKKLLESSVHRPGKMDVVLIRTLDDAGAPSQIHLISGLFTRRALGEAGGDIPVLRQKLDVLRKGDGTLQGAHVERAIMLTFNSMPIEYLFSADAATLHNVIQQIMDTEQRQEISVFCEMDASAFCAFVLVSVPRDRYTNELHEKMRTYLKHAFGATYDDSRELFGSHDNVLVYFYLTTHEKLRQVEEATLRVGIKGLARTWEEGLRGALLARYSEEESDRLFERFAEAFPEEYQVSNRPEQAAEDVKMLLALEQSGRMQFRIAQDDDSYVLRMYETHLTPLTVSLPILHYLGFEVQSEVSVEVNLPEGKTAFLNIFQVSPSYPLPYPLIDREVQIAKALSAIFEGRVESDRLNTLVLVADVSWRFVDMLRAYIHYNRQLSSQSPLDFSRQVCLTHADASRLLIQLFEARFDPALVLENGQTRQQKVEVLREAFLDRLRKVELSSEDKVLRNLHSLIEGTLRTNFYRHRPYLSFKFDPALLSQMIDPKPFREIFVHHPEVEGVHLRGGPIARGGLRWSDRHDDYRIEVLGLMTTQQVKNVVIVPVGSKGGFILKRRYTDRKLERREADRLYEVFISGLLDVTDNIVDGKVVAPENVVRWDNDDPYLVVAADKGTAHLSNTANKLSLERGFWLGDAFASGGSNGYDHKALAITSRGAWESVKRLFLEMGPNPEKDVITCVGIGDMAGDVFGNGLLRSRTIKLVGAFNHMHVFLDPNPDPETSFVERHRLFDLPGSTWDDYDVTKISQGGGVFKRTAKAIPLSPELKQLLGVQVDALSGDEVIHLLLKLDVDLLWNGGIGTYIKASSETHIQVGDRVNDAVRADAKDVRAKVISEGGNLGLTMAARLEYAEKGGRLNTDAIDNSGGVDTSDHEVNLKILFEPLCRKGVMTYAQRNEILMRLSDEVCDLVLFDNYSQNLLISLDERRSKTNILAFSRLIDFLVQNQGLNRTFEGLPTAQELTERRTQGKGLLRPELSKLLAYTKMYVFRKLMEDPNFEGKRVDEALYAYFPKEVVANYQQYMKDHPLRREIAATYYSNRIVDSAGMTFFYNIWEDTSYDVSQTAFGYLLVNELLSAGELKKSLLALEGQHPVEGLYQAYLQLEDMLALLTRRVIRRNFDVYAPTSVMEKLKSDFDQLRQDLPNVLVSETRAECERRAEALMAAGLPEDKAKTLAWLTELVSGADIALLRTESGFDLRSCAWLYHRVGEDFGLRAALSRAHGSANELADWWNKSALSLLRARLVDLQHHVCVQITKRSKVKDGIQGLGQALEAMRHERAGLLERVKAFERRQARTPSSQSVAPMVILSSMLEELLTH